MLVWPQTGANVWQKSIYNHMRMFTNKLCNSPFLFPYKSSISFIFCDTDQSYWENEWWISPKQFWSYLTVKKNPLASLKIGYWFSRLVSQSVHPKSYWVKDWCQGKICQAEIFAIYSNIHIWSGLDIFLGFQISLGFWVHSS